QTSNIGVTTRDLFAVVSDVGVSAGVELSDHLELHAGYNYVYFSGVARPGESIDRRVNINLPPPVFNVGVQAGNNFPERIIKSSEFWMQGFAAGATLRW